MVTPPWIVPDELWQLIAPLLPTHRRRKRLPERPALCGILFVLHTGSAWRHLPPELGFGSGITCWRRLDEWPRAGVWERLHGLLLSRLRAAGEIDFSRARAGSSQVPAKKAAPRRGTTSSSKPAASRGKSADGAAGTVPASVPSAGSWSAASSWLHGFRRRLGRYERCADIREAFLTLACRMICFRRLRASV